MQYSLQRFENKLMPYPEVNAEQRQYVLFNMYKEFSESWRLSRKDLCKLLRIPIDESEATSITYENGNGQELGIRIRMLFEISRYLYLRYDEPACDAWMTKKKRGHPYCSKTPLEYLLSDGDEAIVHVFNEQKKWFDKTFSL